MRCVLFRDNNGWHWVVHRLEEGTPVCHSGALQYEDRDAAISDALRRLPSGVTIEVEDISNEWAV
jgi:hypothetical protein